MAIVTTESVALIRSQGPTGGSYTSETVLDRGAFNAVVFELSATPMGTPTKAPTLVASSGGGSLPTETVYQVVTAIDPLGHETTASLEGSAAVVGPTGSVASSWPAVAGAASYRVYLGTAPGGENVFFSVTSPRFVYTGQAGTAGTPPVSSNVVATCDLTTVDSARADGPFSPTIDTAASLTGLTPSSTLKIQVTGIHQYCTVQITVHSGFWTVQATPIYAVYPIPTSSGPAADVNLAKVGGTAIGSGNPVPVSVDAPLPAGTNAIGGITAADGALATIGATTDAKVIGDVAGTVSAKLRYLSTVLASVWDSVKGALIVETRKGAKSAPLQVVIGLLAPPAAPTLGTATSGGTVAAGTYLGINTYVNAQGETLGSSSSSITTSGSTSTITTTSPAPSGVAGGAATGYYTYLTQAGGAAGTETRQQVAGSPTPIGTNFVLTAPPTSGGAAPPAASTAGVPSLLLAANANRLSATLVNLSDTLTVWLGRDNTITIANATPLGAGSGSNPGQAWNDGDSSDAWWGVASGAPGVAVTEIS